MKFIKNISWTFSSNLIVSFTKWLILVIIAKILTPEDVGAYSLAFAIGSPITLFANMKLRALFLTEEQYTFKNYMDSRNLLSLLAFTVLLLISLFIYPQYIYIIILVGLIKIFDLQSDMYYALPHKEEDMDFIGKIMIIKHVITLFAFFITILLTNNLITSLFIQLIVQILFLYLFEKQVIRKRYSTINESFELSSMKKVIWIGIPLGFVQLIVSLNTSYPRYILEYFESTEILGYFSAIAYILVIGNMMMNAVAQTFIPFLAKKINGKEFKSFKRNVFVYLNLFSLGLGVILILFSLFFGEVFLSIVYGTEYAEFVDVLVLMSIAMAFSFLGWTFDIALLAMRYISIQPKISIITLVINLIIGYILIENYGVLGAAHTLIVTNIVQIVLRAFFVNRKLQTFIDDYQ